MTTTTTINGVTVSTSHFNSFSYRRKNSRQGDALAAAALLLIGNGINHGAALLSLGPFMQTFMLIFFVGMLIGAFAASFLLHKLKKSIHYYIAGVFTLISGILFLAIETEFIIDVPDGYVVGNFFSGLAFGIVLLTSIIHGGGITVKYLRGAVFYQLQTNIDDGILLLFIILRIIFLQNKFTVYPFEAIGITLIVCSVLSILATFFLCIESPEFLYETNNNSEALITMKRLRKENMDTLEIVTDLDEIQNSVRNNNTNLLTSLLLKKNLFIFIKIFLLRFAHVLATSIPLNIRFLFLLQLFFGIKTVFLNGIVLILVRVISELIGSLAVGILGHKKPLILSLFSSGLLLIIINSIYIAKFESTSFTNSTINCLGILILIFQFTLGFGSGSISLIAMSEGFSFNTKTYYNAIIIGIECIIQIIIITTMSPSNNSINVYIFVTGFVQLIVAGLAMKFIPETHQKSLKESNELYSK